MKWLEEAPADYKHREKKIVEWSFLNIIALQQLYYKLTRAVYLWVQTTVEGYIIEFVVESR